jgi:hypothetical protein
MPRRSCTLSFYFSVKAIIVKANVAAINLGTNERYETTANAEGEYYLPNLPPGLHRIEIELPKEILNARFDVGLTPTSTASPENAPATPASAQQQTSNDIPNDPTAVSARAAERTPVRRLGRPAIENLKNRASHRG